MFYYSTQTRQTTLNCVSFFSAYILNLQSEKIDFLPSINEKFHFPFAQNEGFWFVNCVEFVDFFIAKTQLVIFESFFCITLWLIFHKWQCDKHGHTSDFGLLDRVKYIEKTQQSTLKASMDC